MSRSKSSPAVAQAALLLTLLVAGPALSEPPPEPDPHAHHHTARADAHAPIGVMVDHTHAAGEVMLSYRYSRMTMTGNRDGTDRVSLQDVLAQYPVAPRSMDMEMHMFGLMYAPIDQLTLALMVPYTRLSMEHTTRMGVDFTTKTDGLGDIRLTGLVPVLATPEHKLHLSLGLSFPTGSIDERGQTVRCGDWVAGDETGVVVVPKERAVEIANRAVDIMERENRFREEIKRGSDLSSVAYLEKWEKIG